MDGVEWSNFSEGVCVDDEANFMSQLFPNSNNLGVFESNINHHMTNSDSNGNSSSYYSSDTCNNSNYYQQTTYRNPHVGYYKMDSSLVALDCNVSAMPIEFLQYHMDDGDGVREGDDDGGANNLEESPVDDVAEADIKTRDSSENLKKRVKPSDIPKGKRNVKAKKKHTISLGGGELDEEENGGSIMRQSSSSGSLGDDCSSKGTIPALNSSNGKTRASRGSATDPQSLYAKKRRERINERLKILQTLVPNGTKVDISTMLEEAVHYVKFLHLQIKLLSSAEMWMYAPIACNGMNLGLDFNNIHD